MEALVGFSLAPSRDFLTRCAPVIAAADVFEVLPEGLIAPFDTSELRPNGVFRDILELQQRHGCPVIAHGSGLSMAGAHPLDAPRTQRWLARARALAERLELGWYTDHLGITAPAGVNLMLPLGLPPTTGSARATRARLAALADATGTPVGVENSVVYAPMADPADEAAFLGHALGDDHHLLLDVHNLWVHACNLGLDVERWLATAPLHRVIEIHVSGGVAADLAWTGGEPLRLDSHDTDVPADVWALLARVLPRCPGVRAVVLERLEGTVGEDDVDRLLAELDRIRSLVRAAEPRPQPCPSPPPLPDGAVPEQLLADVWCARDPMAALRRTALDRDVPADVRAACARAAAQPAGVAMTRRLLLRLRFDRLLAGNAEALGWFEADTPAFAEAFQDYAVEVPPTAFFPGDEAALWRSWLRRRRPGPPRHGR